MDVIIIWHRFWFDSRPIMGLCSVLADDTTQKINGLPIKNVRYWFRRIDDDTYYAYSLTEKELEDLELERQFHQGTIGCIINHDSTFGYHRTDKVPECLTDYLSDKNGLLLPEGAFHVFNAGIDMTDNKKVFTFKYSDFMNPGPRDVFDGKCTF